MRQQLVDAIERIVKAECEASGAPAPPEFERYDEYPLTANDPEVTARVATAFRDAFGDRAFDLDRQSASEDFSAIPRALGVPYTYWGIGGVDERQWREADAAGAISQIPANHSPQFAPVIQPTLRTGAAAIVVAALAWLAR
jgi:hippurate hydrolase